MKNILKLLCFLPLTVLSQVSETENYVHVTTYQEAVSEAETATTPEDNKIESVTYYDGLGRVKQTTQLRAGGNKQDIIIPVGRDAFGRATKSYLPYAIGNNNGTYRNNALEELNGFYNTEKYEFTTNPYSETITEVSPINRVEETAAPGNSWAYDATNTVYENPMYIAYPTTTTHTSYWTAHEIFYVSNLPDPDDTPIIIGENFLSIHIANGTLRLRADWDQALSGTSLLTGKLHRIDVYPAISYFDMGAIKDKLGNDTDYSIRIEDNYVIIYKTIENPALLTEGIGMDITYDLTQVQVLSSYTDKHSTNHTTKAIYGLNTVNEVARFDVVLTAGVPALVSNGYYPAGELTKVISKDENWILSDNQNRTTEGFTNKSGQALLQRSYNEGVAHDTYSVYDDFGNLTFVIPPKVDITDGISSIELAELCYQYRYDERNRLVEKKIPGKGWEYIVYNRLDQPIMTQDANQRAKNEWLFTTYDSFGRVAYTGIDKYNTVNRVDTQLAADNAYKVFVTKTTNANTYAGTTVYYSKDSYPVSFDEILTINYYDDYRFATTQEAAPTQVFGQNISPVTKSLPTGSKIRVLDTNDWISSVIYYDDKARPVYTYSTNTYLNTIDHAKTLYDFAGRTVKSRVSHTKDTNTAIVTLDTFTYDHMGRLLEQYQCIGDSTLPEDCNGQNTGSNEDSIERNTPITTTTDLVAGNNITLTPGFSFTATATSTFSAIISGNQDAEMLVSNTYDELGVLENMAVGNTKASPLQTVDYAYNVRGWLTDINDVDAMGNDLFSFRVSYDAPAHGAQALYNGNIAAIDWKTANDLTQRWYTYDYDPMNRIKQATDNADRYSLSNVTYDKNGNILSLQRKGHTNAQATSFGTMDALTYEYGIGNTLEKVTDTSNSSFGFTDGSNTTIDYEYDVNGNMIKDRNKEITDIDYNYFNLPTQVSIGTGTVTYVYDAAGGKQKKIITDGSSVTTTEYAGNYSYKNGTLEFFGHAQGYIERDGNGNFEYIYQYTDHLGNIRLSYSDKDGDGRVDVLRNNTDIDGDGENDHEILAENNYYPFGLQHKGYNNTITGREHPYKYNGTELTEDLGYNMYEMPLRAYDPAIARWNRIDPVVHHGLSPYNAFDNNPVFYADPSGADSYVPDWLSDVYNNSGDGATRYSNDGNGNFKENSFIPTSFFEGLNSTDHFEPIAVNGDNNKDNCCGNKGIGAWLKAKISSLLGFFTSSEDIANYEGDDQGEIWDERSKTNKSQQEFFEETTDAVNTYLPWGTIGDGYTEIQRHGNYAYGSTLILLGTLDFASGGGGKTQGAKKIVKFGGDEAVRHFGKHGKSIMNALGMTSYNLKNYINDANHVIKNGIFIPKLNGYIRIVGGVGSAKFGFVGLNRTTGEITTFHIKSIKELVKKVPSLFGY